MKPTAVRCALCGVVLAVPLVVSAVNRDEVLTPSFRAEINGGVVVVGCGLRGGGPPVGRGNLVVAGLPADATVLRAILHWTLLEATPPSPDIVFHLSSAPPSTFTGRLLGQDEPPCWSTFSGIFGFSADVTAAVKSGGAGTYKVELPDSGDPVVAPSAEGAALVVVYCSPTSPGTDIVVYEGLETQDRGKPGGGDTIQTVTGFDASSPVRAARASFVVSDGQGQGRMGSAASIAGTEVIDEFTGDEGLCASPDGVYFDTDTVDVAALVPPGATSLTARVLSRGDCVSWSGFVLAVSSDTVANAAAGCPVPSCPVRPRAVPGPPVTVCAGKTVRLDASASETCDPAGLSYRWSEGANVLCTQAQCDVTPLAATTYTLEVECLSAPSCRDTATVTVSVTPDIRPGNLGNTLRATRSGSSVVLSWGTDANASTYLLRRGVAKGMWPPSPQRSALPFPAATEPDVPAPPSLYFYRAAGASCSGLEGP